MSKYSIKAVRQVAFEHLKTMPISDMLLFVDVDKHLELLRSIDVSVALAISNNLSKEDLLNLLADELGYKEADKRLKEFEK